MPLDTLPTDVFDGILRLVGFRHDIAILECWPSQQCRSVRNEHIAIVVHQIGAGFKHKLIFYSEKCRRKRRQYSST
jgi:hypothetical protein